MRSLRAALVAAAVLMSLPARAGEPVRLDLAQATIADALSNVVTIRARVSELFGDRLLVEDATGRVLVEIGPSTARPADVAAGQMIEVEGRLRGRTIEARRIALVEDTTAPGSPAPAAAQPSPQQGTRPTGQADALIAQLSRPADPATIRATVEAAGFRVAGPPVRKNKHTEIAVRDAAGKAWTASLDRFGRLEEVELDDYDDDAVPSRPRFEQGEVARIVAGAGYTPRADPSRRPEHFEMMALDGRGDLVEVHVDFAGTVYKVEWIR